MASLSSKVRAVLRAEFTALEDHLHPPWRGGHLVGIVVSPDFARMDDRTRMDQLWQVLERGLTADELRRVGPIAALSPAEAETLDNGVGPRPAARRAKRRPRQRA